MSPPRPPSPEFQHYKLINDVLVDQPLSRNEPPFLDIYKENTTWFDEYLAKQKEMTKYREDCRFKEMKRRQFQNVYLSEPRLPKPKGK